MLVLRTFYGFAIALARDLATAIVESGSYHDDNRESIYQPLLLLDTISYSSLPPPLHLSPN